MSSEPRRGPPPPEGEVKVEAAFLRQDIYTVLKATNMLVYKPKLSETGI